MNRNGFNSNSASFDLYPKELTMTEELFHAGLLAMLVALSACGAASHSSSRAGRPTVALEAMAATTLQTPTWMPMPQPQAPFDTTPISPVESVGASPFE